MIHLFFIYLSALDVVVTDEALRGPISRALPEARVSVVEPARDASMDDEKQWVVQGVAAFKRGREHALFVRNTEAKQAFREAMTAFSKGVAALSDFSEFAQVYIELGAILVNEGNPGADACFGRAISMGAGAAPDPAQHPPAVVERYQRVKRQMLKVPRGAITVKSEPGGAQVQLDGRRVGQTPLTLTDELTGDHWLVVRAPGFAVFTSEVSISSKIAPVEVYLRSLSAVDDASTRIAAAFDAGRNEALAAERTALGASRLMRVSREVNVFVSRIFDDEGLRVVRGASLDAVLSATPLPSRSLSVPRLISPAPGAPSQVHFALAILPFGAGQFIEQRNAWGAFFSTTQAVLLATYLTSFILFQADRNATYRSSFNHPSRSEAMKWVANISLTLFLGDIIAGAIDGSLHRERR
jgi:PEGA domain